MVITIILEYGKWQSVVKERNLYSIRPTRLLLLTNNIFFSPTRKASLIVKIKGGGLLIYYLSYTKENFKKYEHLIPHQQRK